jgi:hypothetical protein
MKKKKYDVNAFIKPYLPLDNKRKIDDFVRQIQIQQIPISERLDNTICNNIKDENLRFYYDCISPIKPHNLSFIKPRKKKKKGLFFGGISNTVSKIKNKGKSIIKGIKKSDDNRKVVVNPNGSDYNNQMMKANLSDKFKGYEYGLSDW